MQEVRVLQYRLNRCESPMPSCDEAHRLHWHANTACLYQVQKM